MRWGALWRLMPWALVAGQVAGTRAHADEADVTLPSFVAFQVANVSLATTGNPDPATLAFSNGLFHGNRSLRISVRAEAAAFTPPAGNAIPCSNVSWAIGSAQSGTGFPGTLGTSYVVVYQGARFATSGSCDTTWALSAPGPLIRAGYHTLTVRWMLESERP